MKLLVTTYENGPYDNGPSRNFSRPDGGKLWYEVDGDTDSYHKISVYVDEPCEVKADYYGTRGEKSSKTSLVGIPITEAELSRNVTCFCGCDQSVLAAHYDPEQTVNQWDSLDARCRSCSHPQAFMVYGRK